MICKKKKVLGPSLLIEPNSNPGSTRRGREYITCLSGTKPLAIRRLFARDLAALGSGSGDISLGSVTFLGVSIGGRAAAFEDVGWVGWKLLRT